MSVERVRNYLKKWHLEDRIIEFNTSSATVELAAQALNCIPAKIAKSIALQKGDSCVLIVTAGDSKIDNAKFKGYFGLKAKMLSPADVKAHLGYEVGGVCPFDIPEGIEVYLDISLKRFDKVFPACGSSNSVIGLTCQELFNCSAALAWVDLCKGWQDELAQTAS